MIFFMSSYNLFVRLQVMGKTQSISRMLLVVGVLSKLTYLLPVTCNT